ncbi:MAG: NAD(P)-dependent oxidoreductase [Bacteroidales bacterium]|nr:NAD(P)-dependent oxidoreductase [Bacteroidales bacterium]
MRTVLVTGATGFLGQSVVCELLKNEGFNVIAIGGRPEDKVNPLPEHSRLKFFHLDKLFTEPFDDVETVINCAFARSNDAALLAQAFDFTEKLIKRLEALKVKSLINMSTQGVYKRLPVGELSAEDSPIEPVDLYSMAKYASEKLFAVSAIPHVTNVRLASLMMPQRFLYFFVQKALKKEPLIVTAPNQYAALLDVTDAASGLAALALMNSEERADIYNLGIGTQYSLLEYAESVQRIGHKLGYKVTIDVADNGFMVCAGMDCSCIMKDTGWKPLILKDEMVTKSFKEIQI